MNLSPTFISNIQSVYGEAGTLWLKQLPALLEDLATCWNFRFIEPFPELSFSFVGIVERLSNQEIALLKTTPAGSHIIAEMRCLSCFKNAVPTIYECDEEKNAFLMEYLRPGYSLKTLVKSGQDDEAARIICKTILALQTHQTKTNNFRHLSDFIPDLAHLQGQIDPLMLSKTESLFAELTRDRSQDVLLHGDLHHDNIIRHGSSWKVIDPHGYMGDPAAEVGAMIRNPNDCFPTDRPLADILERRLNILTEELPFDPQKIKAWTFCLTILSAAWNAQDFGTMAKKEIEIASAIDKINL